MLKNLGKQQREYDISQIRVLIQQLLADYTTTIIDNDAPGATWGKILRMPLGGDAVSYPVTAAGLTQAFNEASSGDMVWIPPCSLTGDFTQPAGVGVATMGRKVTIDGEWTFAAGGAINGVVVQPSGSSASAIRGFIGPASGTVYITDCSSYPVNSGAGDCYGVDVSAGGDVWVWDSNVYANASGGGSGYGVRRTAGNAYVTDDGRIRGSTGPFSGTISEFSYNEVIKLKTSTFTQLYNATSAGLTAALAAASSGNVIDLADDVDISGGPWAVGSGITLSGVRRNPTLTGDITINGGSLVNISVTGDVTINSNGGAFDCTLNGNTIINDGTTVNCNLRSSSLIVVRIYAGGIARCNIALGANSYGIYCESATDSVYIDHNDILPIEGATSGVGAYLNDSQITFTHNTVLGVTGGVDLRNCGKFGNCNVDTLDGHGMVHSTGTAKATNSYFCTQGAGDYGIFLTAAITFSHVGWCSISGESYITWEDPENWTATTGSDISKIEQNVLTAGLDSAFEFDAFTKIGLPDANTSNPVIAVGTGGDSDLNIREIGNILFEPEETQRKYKIFYTGYNAGLTTDEKIHYAYSENGITWTKSASNPVISARRAEDPYVVRVGNTYYLYAEDKEAGGENKIRRWSSVDCETWIDEGQISLSDGGDAQSPVVWLHGDTWYMLYEQYPTAPNDIRLATSSDGLTWTVEASNPVFSAGDTSWVTGAIVPDDIIRVGATYYLLYHGNQSGTVREGIAKSANLTAWTDLNSPITSNDLGDPIVTASFLYDIKWSIYYYTVDTSGIYRGYAMDPTLTISGGSITPFGDYYIVAAESGTTDDLDTIDAWKTFQFIVLQAYSGDTITVKHGTGNIYLSSEADFNLDSNKILMLFYDGANWRDINTTTSQATDPYWEPAVIAGGGEILFDANGDVAMAWIH